MQTLKSSAFLPEMERKSITLTIPNKKYKFFLELLKNFNFIEIEDISDGDSKEHVLANLKQGFKDMQAIKKNKLKTFPVEDLFNA
ncbi:MAG: hypothetical protein LBC85_09105 [Fibromonadaceae bacterium]|nr:hypothetical protein [Fibromonadaceae bacterium]